MSRGYPIWVDVTSCIYKSDKSYGIRRTGRQKIYVGTSSKNSYSFADVEIQRIELGEGKVMFCYWVDNILIKEAILKNQKLKFTKEIEDAEKKER